jgi:CRISPR/Cas system-associated protein Cas5 (RAMP superfamily)
MTRNDVTAGGADTLAVAPVFTLSGLVGCVCFGIE